ncbi:binding protein 2 [Perilla frutescens var. hirtella]|uniref:Polyadenylate-binding protein n=1 Tax=Perilla frutescens var. hirtella TaxID=608512 RepID=A0AAD4JI86_PERFH|nr:binding protein 2 [Perilla frutescens var. hirtella]
MAAEANAVSELTPSLTALYVGDVDGNVTEEDLRRLFIQAGDVVSVKICVDEINRRSLGYGYVNFSNPEHAEKALEDLNFTRLNGRCIRIAYSNREGTLRKSGQGNIFVKNLDKSIDHKALHDIFSPLGKIISCKVETDSSGQSRGYGYVQYKDEETALRAIERLHGELVVGKELYAVPYVSKLEREMSVDKTKFTNVFVKNISASTTEEDLKSIFGEFGPMTSVAVMRDEAGHSKCFGFVNFNNAEDAARSVEMLNGRKFNGMEWYVSRAQKKSERELEIKLQREQIAKEVHERSLGMNNLYIKNIDDNVDNEKLKGLFAPFGNIVSCKVMIDPKGISKGYGFVAFSTSQEASKAISEMNGKIIGSKPLYVSIAEKKEDRHERLQSLFTSNVHPTMMLPAMAPPIPIYSPGRSGVGQPIFYSHVAPPVVPNMGGFGYQQHFIPAGVRPSGPLIPSFMFPMIQRPGSSRRGTDGLLRSQPPFHQMLHQQIPLNRGFGNFNVTSQGEGASADMSSSNAGVHRSVPVGTLASALANATPSEQQSMLGVNLYPLVEQLEPEMAGKVTGMLLEMDQTEVLHLLESPESLRANVVEAMEVLTKAPERRESSPSEKLALLSLN